MEKEERRERKRRASFSAGLPSYGDYGYGGGYEPATSGGLLAAVGGDGYVPGVGGLRHSPHMPSVSLGGMDDLTRGLGALDVGDRYEREREMDRRDRRERRGSRVGFEDGTFRISFILTRH